MQITLAFFLDRLAMHTIESTLGERLQERSAIEPW